MVILTGFLYASLISAINSMWLREVFLIHVTCITWHRVIALVIAQGIRCQNFTIEPHFSKTKVFTYSIYSQNSTYTFLQYEKWGPLRTPTGTNCTRWRAAIASSAVQCFPSLQSLKKKKRRRGRSDEAVYLQRKSTTQKRRSLAAIAKSIFIIRLKLYSTCERERELASRDVSATNERGGAPAVVSLSLFDFFIRDHRRESWVTLVRPSARQCFFTAFRKRSS